MYNRTYSDLKRWNPLIGKIFYERGKGQYEGMIRTYRMHWNGIANRITPQVSNFHHAEPTADMEPYDPRIMSAVNTFQPPVQSEFY